MTEDDHRKWDIIIKAIITPVIAVVTILFGLFQYLDSQDKALEREYQLKKTERQEKQFEEKSSLYKETRQIVSFLATNKPGTKLYIAKEQRFWELYWGDLAAVESKEIEGFMVNVGWLLKSMANAKSDLEKDDIQEKMHQFSLHLTRQTQAELGGQ